MAVNETQKVFRYIYFHIKMRSPFLRKLHYKLTDITNIPITFKLVQVEANDYAEGFRIQFAICSMKHVILLP